MSNEATAEQMEPKYMFICRLSKLCEQYVDGTYKKTDN